MFAPTKAKKKKYTIQLDCFDIIKAEYKYNYFNHTIQINSIIKLESTKKNETNAFKMRYIYART